MGFRGKARHKNNFVFLCAAVMMALYLKIGQLVPGAVTLAKQVPFLVKILSLLGFFTCVWYLQWHIYRRVRNPTQPALPSSWYVWPVTTGLVFAFVTADCRTFFLVGTAAWVLYMQLSWHIHRRRITRAQ